ncbi:GNAT family N-acetyltransferase [Bacteroidota bacterium]
MSDTIKIALTVPNDIIYLPLVLSSINTNAGILGFEKTEIKRIELGAEEAISNVFKYAFDKDEEAYFDVILENSTTGLKLIIREKGIPFDPALIPDYNPEEISDKMSEKGLGVYLMREFFDDVSFKNLGKEGRETILFKHLGNKTIDKLMSENELGLAEKEKEEECLPKGSVSYTVRRMQPEEAVDVSKGAYSSYGYTYVLEHIYYPHRVREMNKRNELISFVGVNNDNKEIIAHCALEIEEADLKVPQLGVAFTKPKYRGQGCMNRLGAACMEDAEQRGLYGIYARGVTTHPYSQKSLLKFNMFESAIYISSGMLREYKGMEGTSQRESVVIHYRYLNPPEKIKIYPPVHHIDIINDIYENLNFKPEVCEANYTNEKEINESVIDIQTDKLNMVGKIRVNEYGKNILHETINNLKSLCLDRFETIYLYLKISHPLTAKYTKEFERMGFFFCGIIPGSEFGDSLVLQYLNNYKINYDKIKVASEFGEKLLAYIKDRDPNQDY